MQPLPSLSRIDNDLVCAHMESAWQGYKTTMDPVCAPLASTIKPTWMCQEYLTLLEAYIHDRDNTAINIESPTIEIAPPQRGEKRSYQVANSASPQTGEKRPYQVAYVASPQHGPKRTYEDADLASPVGLQTTTPSVEAKSLRVGAKAS